MNDQKLSAYELKRLDNIARNDKRLKELGLHDAKKNLRVDTQGRDTATQPKKKKKRKRNDEDTKRLSPTRRSPRRSVDSIAVPLKVAAVNNDDTDDDFEPAVSSSEDDKPPLKKGRFTRFTGTICKAVGSAVTNVKTFAKSMDNALGETVVDCLAGTVNECYVCGKDSIRGQYQCSEHLNNKHKKCDIEGCTNHAQKGGVCERHSAWVRVRGSKKRCDIEGCTNYAVKKGVCKRHGAKVGPRKLCDIKGCTNTAKKGGVCKRHGAEVGPSKKCDIEGCTNIAQNGGVCKRHGAKRGPRKKCDIEGCTNIAQKGGFCNRHGSSGAYARQCLRHV